MDKYSLTLFDQKEELPDWERWDQYATKSGEKIFFISFSVIFFFVILAIILLMLLYVPFQ